MVIRLSVLVSGAALMAVEILAFLINATTFGSAWREMTAVIAVFLMAMSAGYWAGGALADRAPRPITLVLTMATGAGFVAAIPSLAGPLKGAVFSSRLPFEWHGLLAAALIYFAPALLLAATSPIGARLLARSVAETGSVAGGMAAVSTVGSIVGTIGTGHVLIDSFSVNAILYMLAGAVLGAAALLAAASGKRLFVSAVGLVLVTALAPGARAGESILHETQTLYHHLSVVDVDGTERQLRFNHTVQGTMHPSAPLEGLLEYVDYTYCALLFNDRIERALVIGLASGSVPKRLLHDFPRLQMDVVEIDPAVVRVTTRYFGLAPDPRLTVHVGDGRVFLNRTDRHYDLILVDAYAATRYGLVIPRHLATKEFFEEARGRLTAGGVLMYNVARFPRLATSIARTLASVFPSVYAWDAETLANTMFLALPTRQDRTREELLARARGLMEGGRILVPNFLRRVGRVRVPVRATDALLLTDQYAPVDRLMRP